MINRKDEMARTFLWLLAVWFVVSLVGLFCQGIDEVSDLV